MKKLWILGIVVAVVVVVALIVVPTEQPKVQVERGSVSTSEKASRVSEVLDSESRKGDRVATGLHRQPPSFEPGQGKDSGQKLQRSSEPKWQRRTSNLQALRLYRKYVRDRRNPYDWIEYAKALDRQGMHDMAIAALERALSYGGHFQGRREVERLLQEYKRWIANKNRGEPPPIREWMSRKSSLPQTAPKSVTRGSAAGRASDAR